MTSIENAVSSSPAGDCAKSIVNADDVFSSSTVQLLVGEQKFTIRVLKMIGSTLLFVCNSQVECLNELGVAMCAPDSKEVLATTVLGSQISSDSQRMAEKLTRRYGRQFFVSYNVQLDRISGPLLDRQLSDYIHSHEQDFI